MKKDIKIGVAGCGALGSIVVSALQKGIEGFEFIGISDTASPETTAPNMSFNDLTSQCDWVVECLPPKIVPEIADIVLSKGKTLVMISACAMLLYPELYEKVKNSAGRVLIPSGALSGLDAVVALGCAGIESAKIATTKHPRGLSGAPYIIDNKIDLETLSEPKMIFRGNAFEAAKAFPANVNVAATLSIAGIGPERTQVEVWADPAIKGNSHKITVTGGTSTITSEVLNLPDPSNPKSSQLAGYSIVAFLKKQSGKVQVV
ncbi:MAG: DUF108 domain-containing protein [Alphaproteobacteria bacterium]|nr:DUF108 domain-containing protein [Alphaproteobacteria bacterium]NCQ88177.1 DUF108 domain-containing protein [Alphaproteobacteria bacterium]NCT05316.1 DUF108 domain-containing protein [Alphaproteobacteria bacterium]